jgi:hypothetical protein
LKNIISLYLPLTCTDSRIDTKFRDGKFRNKNYFPISRNYNSISVQICKKTKGAWENRSTLRTKPKTYNKCDGTWQK